jgi:hypothetical protein
MNITTMMTKNTKTTLFLILAIALMIATRGHNSWIAVSHLPDFTIPALFIAGVYFRSFFSVFTIIVSAVAIDNYAIVHQGISANCITPAYSFLPLTYYAVFYFSKYITSLSFDTSIVKNAITITAITSLQWFLATISYYAFTKTFAENGFNGFGEYLMQWSLVEIPPTLYFVFATFVVVSLVAKTPQLKNSFKQLS